MEIILIGVGVLITSYLLGSFPTAYLVVRTFTHKNILQEGTGNVGTMNTHRATGSKWMTAIVFFADHLKGVLAYLVAVSGAVVADEPRASFIMLMLGFFGALLGHNYPIWLRFKGGKGLATAAGYFLLLNWMYYAMWVGWFAVVVAISQYMVLSQFMATVLLVTTVGLLHPQHFWVILPGALLVLIKHWPRTVGVFQGKEPKFYYSEEQREKQGVEKQV